MQSKMNIFDENSSYGYFGIEQFLPTSVLWLFS